MSIQQWQQLAEEKSAVDQQTQDIHQKIRMNKISKELGQLSGFLNLLQKGLMKRAAPLRKRWRKVLIMQWTNLTEPTRLAKNSDRMHQHQNQHHHHHHHPPYQYDDGGDFPQPPPPLMEGKSTRKEWGMPGPVEPGYLHESTLLQTVNQLITKYGNDPNYIVKSKKSPLHGRTVGELKK